MHFPAWFNITGDLVSTVVIVDYIRLRRWLRTDARAKLAEELLIGVTNVEGVELPDPMDTRWAVRYENFGSPDDPKKRTVIAIGEILVTLDVPQFCVHVGCGPQLTTGNMYGRAVVTAYRKRLAAAVKQ